MPLAMVKIARHKGGRTHFAAAVAPAGNVTLWADDEAKCVPVPEDLAEKVAAHYDGRAHGGVVVFDDAESGREHRPAVRGTEPPERPAPASAPPHLVAEGEFRKQSRVLGEEVEALRAENAALSAKVAELEAIIAEAR